MMQRAAGAGMLWDALDGVLESLQAEGRRVRVFCRDDDVDEDEASLCALMELFVERRIPLNLAVIPGRLTSQGAALVREWRRSCPDLLGIDQHGYRHVNHETAGRKCEFGSSRPFESQRDDIAAGRLRLLDEFGADVSSVFVPPWNRCTTQTRRALGELGFNALSHWRDRNGVADEIVDGLVELPATLDPYRWKQGAELKTADELLRDLIAQLEAGGVLGIMLHHKVMNEDARGLTARLLDALSASSVVGFHTFQELLNQRENAEDAE